MTSPSLNAPARDYPVVIIGAGPAGTVTALELAMRGIPALVLERDAAVQQDNPRGGNNTMRTLEHYRRWGIADALRQQAIRVSVSDSSPIPSHGNRILYATSVLGESMGLYDFDWGRTDDQYRHIAAEPSVSVNQPKSLPILRGRAQELGVTYRMNTEYLGHDADDDGVTVRARDVVSGEELRWRADYLVGADGSYSNVRRNAGIDRTGHTDEDVRAVMCVVRMTETDNEDIFARLRYRMNGFLMIANERIVTNAAPFDTHGWRFTMGDYRGQGDPSDEEVLAAGRAVIGEDLPLEVQVKSSYRSHIRIANSYSAGRVFITGDACHVFPPSGGHNQNLGIGDSVNLGWKLAAVIKGWGGPQLLASYDAERRPMGWQTGLHSFGNARNTSNGRKLVGKTLAGRRPEELSEAERQTLGRALYDLTRPQWKAHGVVLDIRYDSSPIVVADGSSAPEWDEAEYVAMARPGHRAPHFWLDETTALYDRLGPEFTLIAFPDAPEAEVAATEAVFAAAGAPLKVLRLDRADIAAAYGAAMVLVRPDQQVAWRGADAAGMAGVVATITGHGPAGAAWRHDADHLASIVARKTA